MKLLELFSGTGSVGKVARELGYEVVSLDLKNADINSDIMKWDYTMLKKDFDHRLGIAPLHRIQQSEDYWELET